MTRKDLINIDIRNLSEKARRIFEESDPNGLSDLFANCNNIDDINRTAEDLYAGIFGDDE